MEATDACNKAVAEKLERLGVRKDVENTHYMYCVCVYIFIYTVTHTYTYSRIRCLEEIRIDKNRIEWNRIE